MLRRVSDCLVQFPSMLVFGLARWNYRGPLQWSLRGHVDVYVCFVFFSGWGGGGVDLSISSRLWQINLHWLQAQASKLNWTHAIFPIVFSR